MTTSEHGSTHYLKHRKYGAIYADPPWSFRNWSAKGTGRNAVSHYDCMDFDRLAGLPIQHLFADDCALFIWATDPLLPRAIDLMRAWGFEYKTVAFYWVKLNSAAKHGADFFTGLGIGRVLIPNNAFWQREASRCGGRKMCGALWSKSVASIAASQIVSGTVSRGSWLVHISNYSGGKQSRVGIAGAIKPVCSTPERWKLAGSRRGLSTDFRCLCESTCRRINSVYSPPVRFQFQCHNLSHSLTSISAAHHGST
jgi:hypothetical protein